MAEDPDAGSLRAVRLRRDGPRPRVSVQTEDFDCSAELAALRAGDGGVGALGVFVGTVRDREGAQSEASLRGMSLEHYPGMTEASIEAMIDEAHRRFQLRGVRVVHRVGDLAPGDQIVLVAVSSVHRAEALEACAFLMDYLKTQAPFWKKETGLDGTARWVDARVSDDAALARWGIVSANAPQAAQAAQAAPAASTAPAGPAAASGASVHATAGASAPVNPDAIDARALRSALGRFATGVTLVTCLDAAGAPVGLTCNSFNALSLNPPWVLWSLRAASANLGAFRAAGHFAVNVLAEDQVELSRRFASPTEDRFAEGIWSAGRGGVPVLTGAVAVLECRTVESRPMGDHWLFVGEVMALREAALPPLLFQSGHYRLAGEVI